MSRGTREDEEMTLSDRPLQTVEDVSMAISTALTMPMRTRKERQTRAARLADLFDVQARLYHEAATAKTEIPPVYRSAAGVAAGQMRDRARFFRNEASKR